MNVLSPSIIYPELHAALGFGFAMAARFLVPRSAVALYAGVMAATLLFKEACLDPRWETDNPFFWSGVEDLAWYGVGAALGATIA